MVPVLIFLRYRNGALSVEILYFLAGSVMHHSGVVKYTAGAFLSARVVCRIVWRENHRISVTNQIFFGRHPTSQIINTCNLMQLTAVSAVFFIFYSRGILCAE